MVIYTKFTNETNHLKEINDDYIKQIDKLKNEHEEKQQSLILMYSNEIQSLQKKIELLSRHTTTSEPVSEYSPKYNYNNKDKMYSTINNSKIESINKENLSDLDALYFFDKLSKSLPCFTTSALACLTSWSSAFNCLLNELSLVLKLVSCILNLKSNS